MVFLVMRIFLFLLLSISFNCFSKTLLELSTSKEWHRLLHYKKTIFGNYESEADGQGFFLSKKGKTNPLNELKKTIEFLQLKNIPTNWIKENRPHPQCAFPARLRFLKRNLDLLFPKIHCKEFLWWRKKLNAKSVSIVYSSAYPNNPASIFGHTLLKLNSSTNLEQNIKDYSVGFAALTDANGGFIYALKGLFGGYKGQYSTKPYYRKINEYINGESRDLWEYQLTLNELETEILIEHLWELGLNTFFDYYFIDENCSYQLLTLLEVAKPDWNISHGFYLFALPSDTIKRIEEVGGIKSIEYRPSHQKKMLEYKKRLNKEQKKLYYQSIKKKILTGNENEKTLDALISYFRYINFDEKNSNIKTKQFLRKLLLTRSSIPKKSKKLESKNWEKYKFQNPLKSHHSYRLNLSYGFHNRLKNFTDIEFRSGLHDLGNSNIGYPPNLHIEFLKAEIRYYEKEQNFQLQQYSFVDIISLYPITKLENTLSWNFQVFGQRANDRGQHDPLIHSFNGGGGAYFLINSLLSFYSLINLNLEFGSLPKHFRYGPKLKSGLIIELEKNLKLNQYFDFNHDLNKNYSKNNRYNYHSELTFRVKTEIELRLKYSYFNHLDGFFPFSSETKFSFQYYF